MLAVQVSPHCRTAVKEFDRARREFFAAREDGSLPKGYGAGLMALRDRRPVASSAADIATLAGEIRDENFRIEVSEDGVHVYNRDGIAYRRRSVRSFFPKLGVEDDGAHAFYLGVETARAEIAYRLGKRYAQDEGLTFGVAGQTAESLEEAHRLEFKKVGSTLRKKQSGKE